MLSVPGVEGIYTTAAQRLPLRREEAAARRRYSTTRGGVEGAVFGDN
jgi:hypothetical protein